MRTLVADPGDNRLCLSAFVDAVLHRLGLVRLAKRFSKTGPIDVINRRLDDVARRVQAIVNRAGHAPGENRRNGNDDEGTHQAGLVVAQIRENAVFLTSANMLRRGQFECLLGLLCLAGRVHGVNALLVLVKRTHSISGGYTPGKKHHDDENDRCSHGGQCNALRLRL